MNKNGSIPVPPAAQIEGRSGKSVGNGNSQKNGNGNNTNGLSSLLNTGLLRRRWDSPGFVPVEEAEGVKESSGPADPITGGDVGAWVAPAPPAVEDISPKRNWKLALGSAVGLVALVLPLAWATPGLLGGQKPSDALAQPTLAPTTAAGFAPATPTQIAALLVRPPSATSTKTALPTSTATPIATLTIAPSQTATATPLRPTDTPTSVPTATRVPPKPTATRLPPRPTPTRTKSYVIRPGDSLYVIARRFGTTVDALARANGLRTTSIIVPGQVLVSP